MARSRGPPRLPEADGRVDRAGRRHRVHSPARRAPGSLRSTARRRGARQAAVLRHHDDARRPRHWPPGREPHGASDQTRRQPRSPVERRRNRPVRSGHHPHDVRPRSDAVRDVSRRDSPLGRFRPGDSQPGHRAQGPRRRRVAIPLRDNRVAHARCADSRAARGDAAGKVAPVRPGLARELLRRGRARLRNAGRGPLPVRSGRCDRRARCRRLRRDHAGQRAVRARLRQRPPGPPREGRDEPAVCGRADADAHRIDCRSPPARPRQSDRGHGPRAERRHCGRFRADDRQRGDRQVPRLGCKGSGDCEDARPGRGRGAAAAGGPCARACTSTRRSAASAPRRS